MKKISILSALVILLCSGLMPVDASETLSEVNSAVPNEYLSIDVDRVVIDTDGLVSAAANISAAVDRLAIAIGKLSEENVNLSEADKQTLLQAIESVDAASVAMATLARQIPQSAQEFGERLPQVIQQINEPLGDLSSSLQAASDTLLLINESLPQATENAEQLVNASLDAALIRLSIYTLVLVAIIALALILIVWFIYRQYLAPLTRKLDELVGAPEHFDNMARYMKETSDNLRVLRTSVRGRNRLTRSNH